MSQMMHQLMDLIKMGIKVHIDAEITIRPDSGILRRGHSVECTTCGWTGNIVIEVTESGSSRCISDVSTLTSPKSSEPQFDESDREWINAMSDLDEDDEFSS